MKSFLKNKFKRLTYLASALELEREEIQALDEMYRDVFVNDFAEENAYTIDCVTKNSSDKDTIEAIHNEALSEKSKKITDGLAKQLHRELARKTHPDITQKSEDFKNIQEAYDKGDVISLLIMSRKFDIDPSCTKKELEELETQIENQKNEIKEMTKTIRWMWANSDKSQELRKLIQVELGIDPDKFASWKKEKNQSDVLKDTDVNK